MIREACAASSCEIKPPTGNARGSINQTNPRLARPPIGAGRGTSSCTAAASAADWEMRAVRGWLHGCGLWSGGTPSPRHGTWRAEQGLVGLCRPRESVQQMPCAHPAACCRDPIQAPPLRSTPHGPTICSCPTWQTGTQCASVRCPQLFQSLIFNRPVVFFSHIN